jgi:hypothetical protein
MGGGLLISSCSIKGSHVPEHKLFQCLLKQYVLKPSPHFFTSDLGMQERSSLCFLNCYQDYALISFTLKEGGSIYTESRDG